VLSIELIFYQDKIRFTFMSNNNRSKKEGILPTNHKRVKDCEEEEQEEECVGHGI
jgi:2-oxo-4-hydroxy-4-carboxy--5-ureidoimidazoline (OHCU) decarboxylase